MIHSKYGSEGQVITQEEEEEEKEDHGKENSNTNAIVDALQPANMTHAGLYLCQMTGKPTCLDTLENTHYHYHIHFYHHTLVFINNS